MNLNQDQCKHLANVFHTLAIAVAAPTVLNLAGFSDVKLDNVTIVGMFIASVGLEYLALYQLKTGSKQNE